jgi:YD repeat-containing protein
VTDPLGGVTTMVYDSVDRLVERRLLYRFSDF